MQAVGRLGSYISRSVYTVSGPFHPFGGAVDIIVVEQPDGSYKSSPWYVRFGKFQGVLKTKEKIVNISVNGVEADFHMLLDHKGEAYFLKEVDIEEGESVCSPPSSSGDDTDGNRIPLARTNSRRSQILGIVFGRRSKKEDGKENGSDVVRMDSLERAEIAADLLELKWSTNLASPRHGKDNASRFSNDEVSKNANEEESTVEDNGMGVKCVNSEVVVETATSIEENAGEDTKLSNSENSDASKEVETLTVVSEVVECDSKTLDSIEKQNGFSEAGFCLEEDRIDNILYFHQSETSESSIVELEEYIEQTNGSFCCEGLQEVYVHKETSRGMENSVSFDVKSKPESDVLSELGSVNTLGNGDVITFFHEENICTDGGPLCSASSQNVVTKGYSQEVSPQSSNDFVRKVESQNVVEEGVILKEDQIINRGPLKDPQISSGDKVIPCMLLLGSTEEEDLLFGKMDDLDSSEAKPSETETICSCSIRVADGIDGSTHPECSLEQSVINDYMTDADIHKRRLRTISSDDNISSRGLVQPELTRSVRSLPIMSPLSSNLDTDELDRSSPAQSMAEKLRILNESRDGSSNQANGIPPRPIDSFRGSRRGWPFSFKRARSMRVSSLPIMDGIECSSATKLEQSISDLEGAKEEIKGNINKKKVRTNIPTSEQLASLKLKEGKNIVVFTFSTPMLGKQQVDARIFLWRWDTRIVISDVDGTITRSDLLGQVMPLVGMDWSQTGVAHLFTAIKDNGYQLLFLSARSISQAFHTRQFLFNIKQDGKALPDGPVVISPDGLFPSLFREVVRRAPHEFKIACLEDIKALFPADTNPFYAGFGNRDTDEFSYLRVGIPRNKIFIINPKGEIVVNRRIDTKSYLSLHTLVHGMFPTIMSSEQEDFNSWNYWKLPPPIIDV